MKKKAKVKHGAAGEVKIAATSDHTVTLEYLDRTDAPFFEQHKGQSGKFTFVADKPVKP